MRITSLLDDYSVLMLLINKLLVCVAFLTVLFSFIVYVSYHISLFWFCFLLKSLEITTPVGFLFTPICSSSVVFSVLCSVKAENAGPRHTNAYQALKSQITLRTKRERWRMLLSYPLPVSFFTKMYVMVDWLKGGHLILGITKNRVCLTSFGSNCCF